MQQQFAFWEIKTPFSKFQKPASRSAIDSSFQNSGFVFLTFSIKLLLVYSLRPIIIFVYIVSVKISTVIRNFIGDKQFLSPTTELNEKKRKKMKYLN
jgi:hypothetical protein